MSIIIITITWLLLIPTISEGNTIQDLLDAISVGEGATPAELSNQGSNITAYDLVYGYKLYLTPSKPISTMTLKELHTFQSKLKNITRGKVKGAASDEGTSAVGKYQVLQNSLFGEGGTAEKPKKDSWAEKLKLTGNTIYTPELQERIGRLALKESGHNAFLSGKKSRADFLAGLAVRWDSIKDGATLNPHLDKLKQLANPITRTELINTRNNYKRYEEIE